MTEKIPLIYLLGAGRSGTTLLATVLNAMQGIRTLGEMHQFPGYAAQNEACSCGEPIKKCPFWGLVLRSLEEPPTYYEKVRQLCDSKERHIRIPQLLISGRESEYLKVQNRIFAHCSGVRSKSVLLDSSKYIARFLMLNRSSRLEVYGIYLIRDVRGVIESFNKNVQTPKKPLATLLYYILINFFGELTSRLYKNVIKVRYEDFIRQPEIVVNQILHLVDPRIEKVKSMPGRFEVPHIIGGNRMKKNRVIQIDPAERWRERMPRGKQIFYYFAALPIMMLNRYDV